jgi:AraC-like DNA-binding protein
VYDAPENEVVLRTVDLELPLMSSNPELVIMFEEKAEEFRAASDVEPELANRVRTVLQRMMRGELPDLGGVARALSISERSLQRKLGQEGVSFQHLVNEVRFSLAQRHLRNREVDAAEVSYLLGFSHPTSFYRAFKRWTGMTPEEYRRSSPAEEPRRRLDA